MKDTDGGLIVSSSLLDAMVKVQEAQSIYRTMFVAPQHPPLTRRQIAHIRLQEARYRLVTAWSVLRGEHECDDLDG